MGGTCATVLEPRAGPVTWSTQKPSHVGDEAGWSSLRLVCLCADHFRITKSGKELVGKPYGEAAEGMDECKAGAQLL